jgi:hypothetical protein
MFSGMLPSVVGRGGVVFLEYFDDAFEGDGLLMLYSGSPREVASLRESLRELLTPGARVSLGDLDFVHPVDRCELTVSTDPRGRGVRRAPSDPPRFFWSMSPSDWERVVDLLDPGHLFDRSRVVGMRPRRATGAAY